MTLTIKNGHVLLDGKLERKNIVVEDGKITEIMSSCRSGGETLDAAGKIILPGLIDIHVHLREPGFTQKEDIASGTGAAAAGGVTTVFDMPNTKPATVNVKLLQEKKELFRQKAIVNYGIYMGATAANIGELMKARNIPGVKLYMGSTTGEMAVTDDAAVEKILRSGRKIVVHAEDETLMKKNEEKYKKENAPEIHARIRSNEVAAAATMKALTIGGNIHITHASTHEEMKMIKAKNVTCDVTPHHLFLTHDELKKQGNFAKMNPPLRSRADADALWQGIANGTVSCIATDHAPHTIEEKEADYRNAPAGVPGLETMLPLLLDAVNKKRLTLQRVAELTSINPARIFSVKNKGKIAVGYDADIVVVDMNKEKTVKNEELFTKCGWSPFNGWKLKGWPDATIVNGKIVYNENEITERNGKEAEFS
jgi:dihydroorotase